MFNKDCLEQPIIEPTINKCVLNNYYHEVPHVCPVHTHIINKHIYKHTYRPEFTCDCEDQVCNIDCGNCSKYM